MRTTESQLSKLAKILSQNHKHNTSLSTDKNFLENEKEKFSRCIFILGAGASFAANNKLFPLGDTAAEILEDKFNKRTWFDHIKRKETELVQQQQLLRGAKKDTFEERLSRLSYFVTEREVQEELQQVFGIDSYPNLSYEIIAHLFKNRFIDVIIDFNFDETLDLILKHELQSSQWVRIVTDGDVKEYSQILVENKLNNPVYIKSHGTASHKSSMRFTKDQYLTIPNDIINLMFSLFTDQENADITVNTIQNELDTSKGNVKKAAKAYKNIRGDYTEIIHKQSPYKIRKPSFHNLNLISLGFELESIELNNLLEKSNIFFNNFNKTFSKERKREINLHYFNFRSTKQRLSKKYIQTRKDNLSARSGISNIELIDLKKIEPSHFIDQHGFLNFYLSIAENSIYRLEEYIERHLLNNSLNFTYNSASNHIHRYLFMKAWQNQVQKDNIFNNIHIEKETKKDSLTNIFDTAIYYKVRYAYECVLEMIKNKGYFDLEDALAIDQRIGFYYDKYYQKHNAETTGLPPESPTKTLEAIGILNINKHLPGISANQNGEFYGVESWLKSYKLNSFDEIMDQLSAPGPLVPDTENTFSPGWIISFFKSKISSVAWHSLKSAYETDPCKVFPNFDDGRLYFFEKVTKPNLIFSETLLQQKTHRPYESQKLNWNRAIIIQDYGISFEETLTKYIHDRYSSENTDTKILRSEIRIALIISDIRFGRKSIKSIREVLEKYPIKLKIRADVFYLPPNLHDHHLHIFYSLNNKKPTSIKYKQSCYYYKKTTRNVMNGVYFENDKDELNHKAVLNSGLKALSRSMWVTSIYHDGNETLSSDMVKSTISGLVKFYNEFIRAASTTKKLTSRHLEIYDQDMKSFYSGHVRNPKDLNGEVIFPEISVFYPDKELF